MLPPTLGGTLVSFGGDFGLLGGELARRRREKNWVFFAVFKAETVFFRSKNFLAAEGGQKILGVGEGQDGGERGGVFQILEIRIAPPRSGGELGGVLGHLGGSRGEHPPHTEMAIRDPYPDTPRLLLRCEKYP